MVNKMTINDYLNKKKEFEFYILNINKKSNDYDEILKVFTDVIINPYVYEENNNTIIISSIINNDIYELVNAIVEDFGINLKVFKSNKINVSNISYLDKLKNIYLKYQDQINIQSKRNNNRPGILNMFRMLRR